MIPASRQGWIAIHRKIWENHRATDPEWITVWIYLLTHATHKPRQSTFKGKKIMLAPGQINTGRKKIAEATGVNESKIYRLLKCYQSEHQIEQQKSNRSTLISILNWDKYQSGEQQNEQQMNINRTSNEHQMNTTQEGEKKRNRETVCHARGDGKAGTVPVEPRSDDDIAGMINDLKRFWPGKAQWNEMIVVNALRNAPEKDRGQKVYDYIVDWETAVEKPERPLLSLKKQLQRETTNGRKDYGLTGTNFK